jgi:hypothetical protein
MDALKFNAANVVETYTACIGTSNDARNLGAPIVWTFTISAIPGAPNAYAVHVNGWAARDFSFKLSGARRNLLIAVASAVPAVA